MFRKSVISITCSLLVPFSAYADDSGWQQLDEQDAQCQLEVAAECHEDESIYAEEEGETAEQQKEKNERAVERELDADEDPLNKLIAERLIRKKEIKEAIASGDEARAEQMKKEDDSDYELYGSLYMRYRSIDGVGHSWQDNGSRIGANGHYQTAPESWLFGRVELGFNLLDELKINRFSTPDDNNDDVYIFDGESVHTRLAYIGFQSRNNTFAIGKNWSTYYQIAGFTDRFDSMGGEAAGAYNAGTDGGGAGTGKADNVFQTRMNLDLFSAITNLKPLSVNMQIQYGEPIPGINDAYYGLGYGVSTIIEAWNNLSFGIAYNHSNVSPDLNMSRTDLNSLSGDMNALLVGARWFNDDWFVGATISKSNNMHTADNKQYFSGIGAEFYGQYQFSPNIWLLGGFNKLKPDSDQLQAQHYELDYSVLGLRYSIKGFSRMFYVENRFDNGTTFDNKKRGNQIAAGIRWGF